MERRSMLKFYVRAWLAAVLFAAAAFTTGTVRAADCADKYGKWQDLGPGKGDSEDKATSALRTQFEKVLAADKKTCEDKDCEDDYCDCTLKHMAFKPNCSEGITGSKDWSCNTRFRDGCFCTVVEGWY
jgi:hypothetical protein